MRAADTVVVSPDRRTAVETARHAAFVVMVAGLVAWFWGPLAAVMTVSLQYDENYSHIVAIPFVSAFLIYLDRAKIFSGVAMGGARGGLLLVGAGIAGSWVPRVLGIAQATAWSVAMVSLIAACFGAFLFCYGTAAFRKALVPLLFLLLMVPLPPSMLAAVVSFLQHWSAEATAVLFDVIGVPFYRQGYVFSLASLSIEIAEECSGIRSTLALFITGLLAGHLFLRRAWSKTTLAALVIPLAIVKNAVRIVVLTMLAVNVDPSFLTGSVTHRYSGIPLFVVTFAILGGIVWILQRSEVRLGRRATRDAG
jgi:exosortase